MRTDSTIISSLEHLRRYGINPLTGEADAYCMRVLCDLSQKGIDNLQAYLGTALQTPENWNSMVGDEPAVGSIMLDNNAFLRLAIFLMFHVDQCTHVIASKSTFYLYGCEDMPDYLVGGDGFIVHTNPAKRSTAPIVGGRNVHIATGRTE